MTLPFCHCSFTNPRDKFKAKLRSIPTLVNSLINAICIHLFSKCSLFFLLFVVFYWLCLYQVMRGPTSMKIYSRFLKGSVRSLFLTWTKKCLVIIYITSSLSAPTGPTTTWPRYCLLAGQTCRCGLNCVSLHAPQISTILESDLIWR